MFHGIFIPFPPLRPLPPAPDHCCSQFSDCGYMAFLQTHHRWLVPELYICHAWRFLFGARQDTLRPRLRFFNFYTFRGRRDKCYFVVLVSSCFFLMIFRCEYRCLGLENHSIWPEGTCNEQLSQKLGFSLFQGRFVFISFSVGTISHGFCCPGGCLEI